jgi:hypothetical protein
VCSPTFEQWLSEAAAAGRPLKEQEVCAAYLYHYHKNGLPAEQEAIYQQSWRKLGGGAWYDRFLNQLIIVPGAASITGGKISACATIALLNFVAGVAASLIDCIYEPPPGSA